MLKLVQIDNGKFDLAFDDPALADEDAAVATLVYAVLFGDSEAPANAVSDRYERRGWWADPQAGCPLWYIRRQPLGSAARQATLDAVSRALTAHGLQGIKVADVSLAGDVSGVMLQISGQQSGRDFMMGVPL